MQTSWVMLRETHKVHNVTVRPESNIAFVHESHWLSCFAHANQAWACCQSQLLKNGFAVRCILHVQLNLAISNILRFIMSLNSFGFLGFNRFYSIENLFVLMLYVPVNYFSVMSQCYSIEKCNV